VRDVATLRRVRSLAIPPAWERVWICPDPRGHIQATGRDARGRKQYRYHPEFRAIREAVKFDDLVSLARALPRLRATVDRHLADRALTRRRVLAALVRLLDETGMRVGHEEYTRANGSYGLTTLRTRHARIAGRRVELSYRGKSGVQRRVTIDDPRVVRLVRRCHGLPCETLFAWLDEAGTARPIRAADVNAYLRRASGADITAKCLRTWVATVRMAQELIAAGDGAALREPLARVARDLGHTPTICKRSYVHPIVLERHRDGSLAACVEGSAGEPACREAIEKLVLDLLEGGPARRTLARAA
jgi:DNA topoisomerase-1